MPGWLWVAYCSINCSTNLFCEPEKTQRSRILLLIKLKTLKQTSSTQRLQTHDGTFSSILNAHVHFRRRANENNLQAEKCYQSLLRKKHGPWQNKTKKSMEIHGIWPVGFDRVSHKEAKRLVLCSGPKTGDTLLKCKRTERAERSWCCFKMHENCMEQRKRRVVGGTGALHLHVRLKACRLCCQAPDAARLVLIKDIKCHSASWREGSTHMKHYPRFRLFQARDVRIVEHDTSPVKQQIAQQLSCPFNTNKHALSALSLIRQSTFSYLNMDKQKNCRMKTHLLSVTCHSFLNVTLSLLSFVLVPLPLFPFSDWQMSSAGIS